MGLVRETSRVCLLGTVCLLVGCSSAQQWTLVRGQHPQAFEKQITKTVRSRFLLFLPKTFGEEMKRWPLIVFLHGSGERGDDMTKVKVHGPPHLVEERSEFPFIVVSPQAPGLDDWSAEVLNLLLDEVMAQLPVDTDRVYLTGLSLGGDGTWKWATENPERFAAIAPICGRGDPERGCRLKNVSVWAFHGAKDPVVSLKDGQEMVDAVKQCGGDVKFTVYPDAGHNAWTQTYEDPDLYRWFLEQKRKR